MDVERRPRRPQEKIVDFTVYGGDIFTGYTGMYYFTNTHLHTPIRKQKLIQTYINIYILIYTHTHIHTYIHTYIIYIGVGSFCKRVRKVVSGYYSILVNWCSVSCLMWSGALGSHADFLVSYSVIILSLHNT